MRLISIQQADFDPGSEQLALEQLAGVGAVACFTGLVRESDVPGNLPGNTLDSLFLEHYPGMTERQLQQILDEASQRWPLQGVRVIHRVGELKVRDRIVFVGVASAHRAAAFEACAFIMDWLKTRAPFWKKENINGEWLWVEQKQSDVEAASRWQTPRAQ